MSYLGMTLEAAPRAFGWGHLANWVRHLPPESATMRWAASRQALPASGGAAESRDFMRDARGGRTVERMHVGGGGVPAADFEAWYYGGE